MSATIDRRASVKVVARVARPNGEIIMAVLRSPGRPTVLSVGWATDGYVRSHVLLASDALDSLEHAMAATRAAIEEEGR